MVARAPLRTRAARIISATQADALTLSADTWLMQSSDTGRLSQLTKAAREDALAPGTGALLSLSRSLFLSRAAVLAGWLVRFGIRQVYRPAAAVSAGSIPTVLGFGLPTNDNTRPIRCTYRQRHRHRPLACGR
jgi:hypothetical protein